MHANNTTYWLMQITGSKKLMQITVVEKERKIIRKKK